MSLESINLFHNGLEEALYRLGRQNVKLKKSQYGAVKSVVVDRKDTFCVLPTGYGKSLIYQLLPFVYNVYLGSENNSIIVISPLNALMVDQITKLREHMDVSVLKASIEVTTSSKDGVAFDKRSTYDQITRPSQIIFAHPEALLEDKKIFQQILKSKPYQESVKAMVIDEAHLVEEWKSFRPCYGKISMLTSIFPNIPFLAMTATATLQMKKDICFSLGLIDPLFIEESPDRPNVFFSASQRPDRGDDKLVQILKPLVAELREKRLDFPLMIVYGTLQVIGECFLFVSSILGSLQYEPVGSNKDASNRLFTQYHAQYPEHERERIVQELVSGTSKLRLLFVTVAFGIGVDIHAIRRIIHIGVPHTIEEYFQEVGRCGRDGLPASSVIYYNSYDLASSRNISSSMVDFVKADKCKREIILNHFGYKLPRRHGPEHDCCDYHQGNCHCDDCILCSVAEMMDITAPDMPSSPNEVVALEPVGERLSTLTQTQKDLLQGYLLNYRQFLHGYGKSCVGSVGLSSGFSLELVETIMNDAYVLRSLDDVKSKLPVFNEDHAFAIFEILKTVKSI